MKKENSQEVLLLLNFSKKAYLTYPPPHWHSEEYSPMPDVRIFREVQQTLHDKSWQRHLVCLSVMSWKMFETKERSVRAKYASRIVVSGLEGELHRQISQKRKSSF